jgi:SAM-dependent MidA family methyltransferase
VAGSDLLSFLRELQQECGGTIPFERFMQEALYHPRFGYYSANISNVGTRGDFSTSVTMGDRLGLSLTSWIATRARELDWKKITVIEIGAGNGALARSILRHLGWWKRLQTDYMIVETSPRLRELQHKTLGRKASWLPSVKEALEASSGRALILSNELVDAFPCRLFQKGDGGWEELGVRIDEGGALAEVSLGAIAPDHWFETLGALPTGQRVERFDSYQAWLAEWAPLWKQGAMLTVDYGDLAAKLYGRRTGGSLRAYWKHQRFTGMEIYSRFGRQDLTADVNFSDVITWGKQQGWNHRPLMTQGEFQQHWVSKSHQSGVDNIPSEASEAFKVLEQSP